MSTENAINNLLEAEKQGLIADFNRDQKKPKAYRLFHKYGVDLPQNVIHYLRDEAGKYVKSENEKKSTKKADSRKVLHKCFMAIKWYGMGPEDAYKKFSDELSEIESNERKVAIITVDAFKKRYYRVYPPENL